MVSKLIIVLILLLINASGGMLHIAFGSIFSSFFFLLTCVLFYINKNSLLSKKHIISFLIVEVFFLVILFINYLFNPYSNDVIYYLSFFIRLSLVNLFLLYLYINTIDVEYHIYKALIVILLLSILNYFLSPIILFLTTDVYEFVTLKTFLYLFNYSSKVNVFGFEIYRNQSIFWEPGILSIYMNLLFFYSYVRFNNNFILILAASIILTTFSSTGFVLLFIQIAYIIFLKFSFKSIKKLIFITPFIILLFYFFILPNIIQKTSGEGVASFNLRMFDLLNALDIVSNHKVFGIGLDPNVYLKIFDRFFQNSDIEFVYDVLQEKRGNSNSLIMLFVQFGLIIGGIYLWLYYKQEISKVKKNMFFFICIISLISEPLLLSNFFMLFPISFFYSQNRI